MAVTTTEALIKTQVIQKAWEDPAFRASLLADPKTALREAFGIELPDHIRLTAVEESANDFFLVIPPPPSAILPNTDRLVIEPAAMWGTGS
ncbi:NHLP leader peptide family RiPP precursor [Saccharibacillus deserti]|uniref:NHLP leader peptide family RiPP precursor n=1 Tax=Saccharibacillus deserti TaxID=1634444 RepID=UPI001554F38C|nr:NHLP leader peptide family RiPP precursor [Saccharibacillus deserti]